MSGDEGSVPAWSCDARRSNSSGELCRDGEVFGVVGDSSCVCDIVVS